MTFMNEKPAGIKFFSSMVIAGYTGMIIVFRTADGHGIVHEIFYP
jgi:hypothetical protein